MKEIKEQISLFDGSHPLEITKPVRLIELFAGIGSQAKALKNLNVGFEHYRVCEFDKYAIKSYNAIHDTEFETSDITQLKGSDLGITDTDKYTYIMTYSFPCTDLSIAGKQAGMSKGSGTRSGLLWEVERLLKETDKLPQILLMENVPQVICLDFFKWCSFLETLGYKNYYDVLNAKNYGIPQNRERCFMVSCLGDYYYDFPQPIPLKLRLKDMLEDNVDEKYYVDTSKCEFSTTNKEVCNTIRCGGRGSLDEKHSWDLVCVGNLKGDKWDKTNQKDNYVAEPSGYYSNASKDFQHPDYHIRKLTPKECYRLMGFSDEDFSRAEKVNSNAQLYKQAGNSIVVNVLMEIFKQMI